MRLFILLAPAYSFSATTASGTAIDENPIVFDEVGLNIGEAYDSTTGKFRKHQISYVSHLKTKPEMKLVFSYFYLYFKWLTCNTSYP